MIFIVDLDDAPWVGAAPDLATIWGVDEVVRADDCKGDFALLKGQRQGLERQ
jgi:hypothetical protein